MRTYVAKGAEAEALKTGANWYVVDATNAVLGRLATRVARILIGKDKPTFTPYLDSGDHVVVINADKIRLTGNKIEQKVYHTHSGYPGGLKTVPVKRVRESRPEWVVREAILGMLPKNKLQARRAKKLRVYRATACGFCHGLGAARRAKAAGGCPVAVNEIRCFPHIAVPIYVGPMQAFAGNQLGVEHAEEWGVWSQPLGQVPV